jgi:hypothetical protein
LLVNPPEVSADRLASLEALARRSELPVSAVGSAVTEAATVLHGWFEPADRADLAASAREFAANASASIGLTEDLTEFAAEPARLDHRDGSSTLWFSFQPDGTPYFRCGMSVTFDRSGTIRTITCGLPAARAQAPPADPKPAIEFVRQRLVLEDDVPDPQIPSPHIEIFDPMAVFGDPGLPEPVWVFHFGAGDRPADVLVSIDGTRLVAVISHESEPNPPGTALPRYHVNPATGVPDFVAFEPNGLLLQVASTRNPSTVAFAFFSRYPAMFGTGDPANQLSLREIIVDPGPDPMTHVVLEQKRGPYPVWGCELRVHLTPTLAIRSISGNYFPDPEVSLDIAVPENLAFATALRAWTRDTGSEELGPGESIEPRGAVILPTALARDGGGLNHLAWWWRFSDADRFVSAATGGLVYTVSRRPRVRLVYDSQGTSSTTNAELQLVDGALQVDSANLDPDAQQCDTAIAEMERFWRSLGRDGWDGLGGGSLAFVQFDFDDPDTKVVETNAEWEDFSKLTQDGRVPMGQTRYSPGFAAAADVVGHEFTHAITQETARLVYRTESGALNESYSDIFGELVFPDAANPWKVGVNLGTGGKPLRDMKNPENPAVESLSVGRYSQYRTGGSDQGQVHVNSGIGNRAAALLHDGDGTAAHPGIGRERITRLYWEALTTRLHPWATYFDVVGNTWQAARDLVAANASGLVFPSGPDPAPDFAMSDPAEVLWAFRQVELDLSLAAGWFELPGAPTTNLTFFAGTSVPSNLLVSDAEIFLTRRREADKALLFQGRARVSTGGTVVDQSGTITGSITGHGVGTTSKEIQAQVKTTDFRPVEVRANIYTKVVAPAPTSPPPPTDPFPSQSVAHWFDNPFFVGKRYGDIVYESTDLAPGCAVSDVVLELLDHHYNVRARHRFAEPPATYGGTGAWIFSRTLGGTNLEVRVRSWHEFGWAVRYRLVYWITGSNCPLPEFVIRDVGPNNL